MSAEMVLGVSHLLIVGITVAVLVSTVPGVVRKLSSEGAAGKDWGRVFRRNVVPGVVLPALFSFVAFLVTYQLATGNSEILLGVVLNIVNSFIAPGVAVLMGVWVMVFLVVWHRRGMSMPEKAH